MTGPDAERLASQIALDAATAALRQEVVSLWGMLEVRDAELKTRRAEQARRDRLLGYLRLPVEAALARLSPVRDVTVPRNVTVEWHTSEDVLRALLALAPPTRVDPPDRRTPAAPEES